MTWSLEDIERDWISGEAPVSALAASPDSVAAAFDRTERALGREWIEKSRISVGNIVRGLSPTLRIVNMGQKLAVLENVTGPERLLDRIRNGDLSAEGELIYCVLGIRMWPWSYIRKLANGKPISESGLPMNNYGLMSR